MEVTKPYEFIKFGAQSWDEKGNFSMVWVAARTTKPYELMGFGAMDVTKPDLT